MFRNLYEIHTKLILPILHARRPIYKRTVSRLSSRFEFARWDRAPKSSSSSSSSVFPRPSFIHFRIAVCSQIGARHFVFTFLIYYNFVERNRATINPSSFRCSMLLLLKVRRSFYFKMFLHCVADGRVKRSEDTSPLEDVINQRREALCCFFHHLSKLVPTACRAAQTAFPVFL